MSAHPDPFRQARASSCGMTVHVDGEPIPLVLDLQGVRRAAKDWQAYSSANPFHITLQSEEALRNFRQLPIETDPPDHTDYRAIVEPLFRRPAQPDYAARMRDIVRRTVDEACALGTLDGVLSFALPLQSRALALLLNVPESEADEWITWGIRAFDHDEQGPSKGARLENYIQRQLEHAAGTPGEDLFSILHRATFRGRPLTYEEKQGFANLVFAGGRDTVIHTTTSILAYIAEHPAFCPQLAADPALVPKAVEEFVRVVTPLTAITRTCAADTPHQSAGGRIGLCWASANRDDRFFKHADRVQPDRAPNPHVAFGFGPHSCLGASHARLLLRTLLTQCAERGLRIQTLEAIPNVEVFDTFSRPIGFSKLIQRWSAQQEIP